MDQGRLVDYPRRYSAGACNRYAAADTLKGKCRISNIEHRISKFRHSTFDIGHSTSAFDFKKKRPPAGCPGGGASCSIGRPCPMRAHWLAILDGKVDADSPAALLRRLTIN